MVHDNGLYLSYHSYSVHVFFLLLFGSDCCCWSEVEEDAVLCFEIVFNLLSLLSHKVIV